MCEFLCGIYLLLIDPKTWIEAVIVLGGTYLGVLWATRKNKEEWIEHQGELERKSKENDEKLLIVHLRHSYALTKTNITVAEEAINRLSGAGTALADYLGYMAKIKDGLSNDTYLELLHTGLHKQLSKDFQNSLLFARFKVNAVKVYCSASYARINSFKHMSTFDSTARDEWAMDVNEIRDLKKDSLEGLLEITREYLEGKGVVFDVAGEIIDFL